MRDGSEGSRSTVLSVEEEAIVIEFRNTLLQLDDCFYDLQRTIVWRVSSSAGSCCASADKTAPRRPVTNTIFFIEPARGLS